MTTIRRTLSPVPRPGGESTSTSTSFAVAVAVASPLSKCSSCNTDTCSSFASTRYAFQTLMLNLFSKTTSTSLQKQKPKPNTWRRSFFQFFLCFIVGLFLGFTPIVSVQHSTNFVPKNQAFSFNHVMSANNDSNSHVKQENDTMIAPIGKLLIIVTTTPTRRGYYLNRLAHTLKLVQPPLLWLVVEMTSQSGETSQVLRKSGVMYRHLVCIKNTTDPRVHQRNVALSHIETHRLDGIVYFADDTNIYSTQLFHHMRQIRRFGTWKVAELKKTTRVVTYVGPVCNGTQVIGWHTNNVMRRFHAHLSGFAFNSTILWDPKMWHRTATLQPIRHLDTVKDGFQASTFIEQVVEGEAEMEGIPEDCSEVLVWHLPVEIDQLSSSFNTTILNPLSISI